MSTSDSNQVTAAKQDPPTARTSVEVAPPQRLEIHIPLITFFRVFAALSAGYAIYVLWPLLLLVFLRDGVSEKHELQKDEVFGDKA